MAPPPNSPKPQLEERASEPSDPTANSRWVHALRVIYVTVKTASLVWHMLPHELQSWLIDRLLG
jgi:hypothetical protein